MEETTSASSRGRTSLETSIGVGCSNQMQVYSTRSQNQGLSMYCALVQASFVAASCSRPTCAQPGGFFLLSTSTNIRTPFAPMWPSPATCSSAGAWILPVPTGTFIALRK